MKILEGREEILRSYDDEADVLYLSLGEPRPSLGVDIGDGVVVRYDDEANEVVGVTLIGLRAKLQRELDQQE